MTLPACLPQPSAAAYRKCRCMTASFSGVPLTSSSPPVTPCRYLRSPCSSDSRDDLPLPDHDQGQQRRQAAVPTVRYRYMYPPPVLLFHVTTASTYLRAP